MTHQDAVPKTPEIIYHYCSAQAFLGIIESGSIWLSSMDHMQDLIEHRWLWQLVIDEIQRLNRQEWLPLIAKAHELEYSCDFIPHCACFSSEADSHTQWQNYADQGKGFAIGFVPRVFGVPSAIASLDSSDPDTGLHRVEYDPAKHEEFVKIALKESIATCEADSTESGAHLALYRMGRILARLGLICKNPKYANEREWRLIHTPAVSHDGPRAKLHLFKAPYELGFRTSTRGDVVPYFKFPVGTMFSRGVIARVGLGPSNPARESRRRRGIELLLVSHGVPTPHGFFYCGQIHDKSLQCRVASPKLALAAPTSLDS